MGLFDPVYQVLDLLFGFMFNFFADDLKLSLMTGIFIVSGLIALITTAVTAKVIDQNEIKKGKKRLKEFQDKINKAQEKKDEKKVKKLTSEMMQVQSEVMKNSIKPLMYTMVPIILVFSWMRQYAPLQNFILEKSYLVLLPFNMPGLPFSWHPGGPYLGWLGWYIVCSFMTSTLIRKMFKIQM